MARPHPLVLSVATRRAIDTGEVTDAVADSAIEHRMCGLFLESCGKGLRRLPHAVAAKLTAYDMAVAARRAEQELVLRQIHERLTSAGIEYIAFKGLVSASRWFENPLHRPFSDIDVVLSHPQSLVEAVKALIPEHPDLARLAEVPAGHIDSLTLRVDGVPVDLQTDPLRLGIPPRSRSEWLEWTESLEVEGIGPLRVFDPEADLVIFLLHQGRDRFRYALGVAEAARRLESGIDWERLEAIARREGLWDQVSVALAVMCDELGRPSPTEVPAGWRTRLWRRLWAPHVRLLGEVGRFRHIRRATWLMPLTARGRTMDALRWIFRKALPSEALLSLQHPTVKGPYLWRLLWARVRIVAQRRLWMWRRRTSE